MNVSSWLLSRRADACLSSDSRGRESAENRQFICAGKSTCEQLALPKMKQLSYASPPRRNFEPSRHLEPDAAKPSPAQTCKAEARSVPNAKAMTNEGPNR